MGIFKQAGRLMELRQKTKQYKALEAKWRRAMNSGNVADAGTYANEMMSLKADIDILKINLGMG